MQLPFDPPQFGSTSITTGQLQDYLLELSTQGRKIVALAGPPAAGKSTLSAALAQWLNKKQPGMAAIFPMDGYHYDDCVLADMGLLDRKGSPPTFDVGGFHHTLARLRYNREEQIATPLFDRDMELARAGALVIANTVKIILVEGNYLLLDEPPWRAMFGLYDISIMVEAPLQVLQERLNQRWQDQDLDADAISAKVNKNDLPNAKLVLEQSMPASFVLRTT